LALTSERAKGEIFNVSERTTPSMRLLAQQVLDAAGSSAELVRVSDDALPDDLRMTRATSQHLLLDASKVRSILGWRDSDPVESLRRTVAWHLEHPPDDAAGFEADDAALAASA
jgi:nucleoside-diphosphate-sugar epimerase